MTAPDKPLAAQQALPLPCPFCGRQPNEIVDAALIQCPPCGAEVHGNAPEDARAAWNRRAALAAQPEPEPGQPHMDCRCYECWIAAGKPTAWLAAWMTPSPDLARSLDALGRLELALRGIADETHLNDAAIVRRALLNIPAPEVEAIAAPGRPHDGPCPEVPMCAACWVRAGTRPVQGQPEPSATLGGELEALLNEAGTVAFMVGLFLRNQADQPTIGIGRASLERAHRAIERLSDALRAATLGAAQPEPVAWLVERGLGGSVVRATKAAAEYAIRRDGGRGPFPLFRLATSGAAPDAEQGAE